MILKLLNNIYFIYFSQFFTYIYAIKVNGTYAIIKIAK